jgi:hypothetical protein
VAQPVGPDVTDSLRTAITGAGLGAIVLELLRRGFDAWQKRQQLQADQRLQQSKQQTDASLALRAYMERQVDDLRDQVRRLREEAEERERRFAEEVRRHTQRMEEMDRAAKRAADKESQINAAFVQFMTVVTMLLPDMPEGMQRRVQNALDRVRQVSGLG